MWTVHSQWIVRSPFSWLAGGTLQKGKEKKKLKYKDRPPTGYSWVESGKVEM